MELLPEAYGAHANNYTTFESEINDAGKPNQVDDAHEENSPMAFGFGMAEYFIAHVSGDFVSNNDANRRVIILLKLDGAVKWHENLSHIKRNT